MVGGMISCERARLRECAAECFTSVGRVCSRFSAAFCLSYDADVSLR